MQFELLARLADARGPLTMTELADGVVYSRSGLTYQAGLLEKAGLITRGPSPDDDRATLVTITAAGLALLGRSCPAMSRSPAACCSTRSPARTCRIWATSWPVSATTCARSRPAPPPRENAAPPRSETRAGLCTPDELSAWGYPETQQADASL